MIKRYMFARLERSENHNRADVFGEPLTVIGFRGDLNCSAERVVVQVAMHRGASYSRTPGIQEMRRLPR